MEPISAFQSNAFAANSQASGAPAAASAAISSDFETFIRMLTAQMQNQDPLNPIESADFATQLATFSSVEQQVLTNDLLTSLGAQMGAFNLSQLSGWVGLEARAVMPVHFDGSPVTLQIEGSRTAQTHQLVTRNDRGDVVARQDVSGESQNLVWQGQDSFGAPLDDGIYSVTVESFSQGALVATIPAQIQARITEARTQGGQAVLVFEGGQEVNSSDILALKQPDGT